MAKRKHHAEEHVNHERWLVSYADMITLLVVLYAMGQTDKSKLEVLRTSLQRAFSVEVLRGTEATSLRGSSGESVIPPPVPMAITQELIAMTGQVTPDPRMATTLHEVREALIQVPVPSDTSGSVDVGASREGIVI